ncbi:bifunctional 4-hydroxy-2-oxoglutarate aldolase/2-dehydro-3-deoxy-phosphogluconate aldolase [Microbacterium sp. LWH3-1.2]|uniref:bifunctional 4-hydroxy-2-oxoglutarate aldolase/2-dehydro-3-deoxy-phosphogluconate aldolase n=1 Tax=Microbacterium sp. LWH3-1.2 TaxID=3135256 RepID=UPI00341F2B84
MSTDRRPIAMIAADQRAANQLGPLAGHLIVPLLVVDDAMQAGPTAHVLATAGIGCAEVTLRTSAGLDAIAAMREETGFVVGAGTVVSVTQLHEAVAAGAQFIVSPGLDPDLISVARKIGVGVLPGVATATEVQAAVRLGLNTVKFFPADRLGGLATIRALAGPFPDVRFIPSGGVDAETAAGYLRDAAVPAVSGSWMATRRMIQCGDWPAIERLSATAAALATSRSES